MSPARLLEHFDRLIDTPDAIPRLRRFILDLAVRGKLVEQDPKDEPAGKLLKRIGAEKTRLMKTGEIRKEKPSPLIVTSEIPFEVPHSWLWSRLGDVSSYLQRGKSPKYSAGAGPLVVSQKCVQWDGLHLEWAKKITPDSLKEYEPIRFLCDGDLLWNSTGTGTIGRVIRLEQPGDRLVCDSHVTVVRCLGVDERFIRTWLQSDYVYGTIEGRAAGATNQVELTASIALKQMTPIPPLAEQHRIVAKVDELMTLCDELEAAQTKREKRRDRLVAATLHGLNNGDTTPTPGAPSTFEKSARFYFNHLPRLTTRPEHINQLRQTILNLAVRGKLVPQDPKDEPAARLLMRIAAAKKHALSNANGARADGSQPRVEMTVPNGWQAVQFRVVLLELQTGPFGSSLHQQDYEVGGTPVINPASIQDGRIAPIAKMAVGRETLARLATFKLLKNDVVMGRRGEMGRCAVVTEKEEGWLCGTGSLVLRFTDEISPWFIVKMMSSPSIREYLSGASVGATMQNLNQSIMNEMPMGLPPLAEQRRIVAKIDELMAYCDELEAGIASAAATSEQFFVATLAEALQAKSAMAN